MSPSSSGQLPILVLADFGPGMEHVVETYHNGKVVAIVHKDDPARQVIPNLQFGPGDPHTYVFVHGGREVTRFENRVVGTHEIPEQVIAGLLTTQYGSQLDGMSVRLCSCYGNMLRPGDSRTAGQRLAGLLPRTNFEAYHGLVLLDVSPAKIRLGLTVRWDPTSVPPGPLVVGPPGSWERVSP